MLQFGVFVGERILGWRPEFASLCYKRAGQSPRAYRPWSEILFLYKRCTVAGIHYQNHFPYIKGASIARARPLISVNLRVGSALPLGLQYPTGKIKFS